MRALLGFSSLGLVVAAVLLLHGAGHASSPFAVAAANAAVKCPDGFSSVTSHGLPAGSDPTATLSDKCALDFGIPAGTKGDKGDTGARGAAGTPGVSGFGPAYATTVKSSKSNSSERARVTLKVTADCAVVS